MGLFVGVCVCVRVRERVRARVCMCVYVRARARVCVLLTHLRPLTLRITICKDLRHSGGAAASNVFKHLGGAALVAALGAAARTVFKHLAVGGAALVAAPGDIRPILFGIDAGAPAPHPLGGDGQPALWAPTRARSGVQHQRRVVRASICSSTHLVLVVGIVVALFIVIALFIVVALFIALALALALALIIVIVLVIVIVRK